MKPVHVGCSGWNYAHWREIVYPKGLAQIRWLEHYAELFDTVEINNTFYRLPTRKAVQGWVDRSPPDFLLTVKASRYLTHIKRLTDLDQGIRRFYACIEPLTRTEKMGPVLWQLPGTFRRDDERLRSALERLPPGRHCFEFRHESWFCEETYAALREHDAALVIGDHPQRRFQTYELTTDWTLVRFHWGHRGRRGNYSDRELQEWADRFANWRGSVEVFAYFNNDWEGFAVRNAQELKARL